MLANKKSAQTLVFIAFFALITNPTAKSGFNANIFYQEVRVPTYPLFDYPPYEVALASTMVDVIINYDLDLLSLIMIESDIIENYPAVEINNIKACLAFDA